MKWTALAIAASLTAGTAAYAQPLPPPPPPGAWNPDAFWRGAPVGPRERIQFLQDRINQGRADGSLDPREAFRVQGELNGTRRWIHQMRWDMGGELDPGQRARVQERLDGISRQIHWLRHDGW